MKLEYLDATDNGRFNPTIRWLVILSDFNQDEALQLGQAIQQSLIDNAKDLDLTTLSFITPINCKLTLRSSNEDIGIVEAKTNLFYCDLTTKGFKQMVDMVLQHAEREVGGHHFLYDTWENPDLSDIEFLFSKYGSW